MIQVKSVYDQDKNLKEEDVKTLMEWAQKQPHLPKINELQTMFFIHSCYYKNEEAKVTIENFFTLRTHNPEIFKIRNSFLSLQMEICLITTLPKKSPKGYTIILLKFLDSDTNKYHFSKFIKYFDMVFMLHLFQEGPPDGYLIVVDLEKVTFTHVTKSVPVLKTFFYYLQEASPMRLKGIHFINVVPFMDTILALMKPFLKKEVIETLAVHNTIDSLTKFVPFECLPEEYGGSEKCIDVLHEIVKHKLEDNTEFFQWEESLNVDESKRLGGGGKLDGYGLQGTFKRLELD